MTNDHPVYWAAKRSLDVTASAAALVILSPLLLFVALAVRASSPGPALFRHERLGRNGVSFQVLKFRTMRTGTFGTDVTVGGDPRVTRVGRFLRRYKIDELPQLANVFLGDMSLVGPRPEVRRYVDAFPEDYQRILKVRPGITDLAAIEYRDEESILAASSEPERTYLTLVMPSKIRLYDEYLRRRSFLFDLVIILRTIRTLFR